MATKKSGARKAASRASPKASRKTPRPKTPRASGSGTAPKADGGDRAEVTAWIRDVTDWRGETLARLRALVHDALPEVEEDIKWRKPTNPAGVPVWSYEGILFTGEVYKDRVKLTFARGAALKDPKKLFNASLTAGTRRAWDLREGDAIDEEAFRALVRQAAAANAKARAGAR